jgi:integrase
MKGGDTVPSLRRRNRSGKRIEWDIRYWKDGKQCSYNIGETDRRTAEKIYHEFCRRLSEGKFDGQKINVEISQKDADRLKISDLASHAQTYAEANKSIKTLEREQLVFNRLIYTMGNIQIAELTPSKIEEYKAARLKVVAATTINIEIKILNTALNQAREMGWLNDEKATTFKQIRTPESEPLAWLDEQQIQLLLSTNETEFKRFLQFLLNTGCRRNEALGVMWDDVDLIKRQIVIRGQIGKMGRRRTVPVNDNLLSVFNEWQCAHEGRVFPSFEPNQVTMKFRRWANQIRLPKGISLHSLRATFACHLIKNGVDIYTVSRLLGHSSVKVTEKHYLALDPQHVRTAVNLLNFSKDDPSGNE